MELPATYDSTDPVMADPAKRGSRSVSIPCNGATSLYLSTGYGHTATVNGIAAVRDNGPDGKPRYCQVGMGPNFTGVKTINPDMPGPINIAPGCRAVQLWYTADYPLTAWCL